MKDSSKQIATNKANAERWEKQTVTVDENWSIHRFDQKNWQIVSKKPKSPENFYGSLFAALQALPAKMLSEQAKGSLNDLLELNRAIQQRIGMAISGIEKHSG